MTIIEAIRAVDEMDAAAAKAERDYRSARPPPYFRPRIHREATPRTKVSIGSNYLFQPVAVPLGLAQMNAAHGVSNEQAYHLTIDDLLATDWTVERR